MNPQQIVMNFMRNNMNPFYSNLFDLAQKGKTAELEKIAVNMCNEKNINFNQALQQFKNSYAQTINNFRR